MSESYPNNSTKIGDIYDLKDGVKVNIRDLAVLTGSLSAAGKPTVDKMGSAYDPNNVIGVFENAIDKQTVARPNEPLPYPYEEIVILVNGPSSVIVSEAVNAGDELMGASNEITELFDGDASAQQKITVANVPIDSVTSVTEDPTGSPTVLTQVPLTTIPSTDEYNFDPVTGIITIGGTSTSGTDNYEVIYQVDSGRAKPIVTEVTESIVVTTHVGAPVTVLPIGEILSVVSTAGTLTGALIPIYSGTPISGEVSVNRTTGVLTFAAADVVTAADVHYKTNFKPKAIALEPKAAGELCRIFVY
jgi:hypothetical protein